MLPAPRHCTQVANWLHTHREWIVIVLHSFPSHPKMVSCFLHVTCKFSCPWHDIWLGLNVMVCFHILYKLFGTNSILPTVLTSADFRLMAAVYFLHQAKALDNL